MNSVIRKILVLLLLAPAAVSAQNGDAADSLFLYRQSVRQLDFISGNMTQLTASDIRQAAEIGLRVENISGGLRPVQVAQTTTIASLYTQGVRTLGRFRLQGNFAFSRNWEDSLQWNMRGDGIDDGTPYYYATPKAGVFERANYNIGGIVAYSLIREKLYIGTDLNYYYNTATGSVDPRPAVNEFRLQARPGITWRSARHTVGVAALIGYGDERTQVAYKNGMFETGSFYPDRINYMVQGYAGIQQMKEAFKREKEYSGIGGYYAGQWKDWTIKANLDYTVTHITNLFNRPGSATDTLFATYQQDKTVFSLLLQQQKRNSSRQVYAGMTQDNGKDRNTTLNGSSYRFHHRNVYAGYEHLWRKESRWQPELGFLLTYDNTQRKDVTRSHITNYSYVLPQLHAGVYTHNRYHDRFAVHIWPSVQLPLDNKLTAPDPTLESSPRPFTQGVVYPDYYYAGSTLAAVRANFTYITGRLLKQFNTGVTAGVQYTKALQVPDHPLMNDRLVNGHRLGVSCSFNLYF
ncbi:DUF6850 family outer membrane beta-barrel protein [Chitinophaga nivalis]|uniref:DUF6850 domain-containing protein n=1 Tax=Chitinophaga nivalis TaxID=2991709 RepID=A0ABT3ITW2_9BACT|nr:DUF6850 family outer membrane beta-barrel protein [Chitinophaga nivalis]MCW3462907.1 hypothetical protein [Chitinophaga nivalis]MCW3487403.1 hypothetical protein [Chitinophaga nivalis]